MTNYIFVRKAVGAKSESPSLKSPTSPIGLERPNHKYIKRKDLGNGKYKYIYEETTGKKAPSSKDNEQLVNDMRNAMSEDKQWKRYIKYLSLPDYNNLSGVIDLQGKDITPESFVEELNNIKNYSGVQMSDYLPVQSSAKELKNTISLAGDRPNEYIKKLYGGKK